MEGSLAQRLRVLRAEKGLTLRQAASLTGVAKETISDVERGVRHPHDVTVSKLAKGYGVPVEELLEEPVLSGKADAPLSSEWALSVADDDAFRRAIGSAPTEELRGLILGLVSGYKPVLLEDARRGRHGEAFRREASRRAKAFSRAALVGEELARRGEEPPERYVLALKRFVDATTQAPEAGRSAYQPRYNVPRDKPAETVEEVLGRGRPPTVQDLLEYSYEPWEAYANDYVARWTEQLESGNFTLDRIDECWATLKGLSRALGELNSREQDALPPQPEPYGLPAARTGRAIQRINGLFGPLHDAVRSKFGESELAKMRQKHAEQEALLGEAARRTG